MSKVAPSGRFTDFNRFVRRIGFSTTVIELSSAVSTLSTKPSPFRSVYEIDGCEAVWPALMPIETENEMPKRVKLNPYLRLPEAVLDPPSATAGLPGVRLFRSL